MEVQRLVDIYEVQQRASTYCNYISYGQREKIVNECFTQKTPGSKVQITNWGVWEGTESIRKLFLEMGNITGHKIDYTKISRHELTTPNIVIAGDGESAIGTWFAPGWECWPSGHSNISSFWNWGAYWMAFRKEAGEWRIWQLKYLIGLDCDTHLGWVEGTVSPRSQVHWKELPQEVQPDHLADDFIYDPSGPKIPHMLPIPKPYQSWSDDMSQIK
jgi:hypothetical protein